MNVSRNLGGTFGISLVQTMLARREQVHQSQYVETLNPLNPELRERHRRAHACADGPGAVAGRRRAERRRRSSIGRLGQQAAMLSYIDVFHVLMIVVFCALPLVFLMQKPRESRRPPGGGGMRSARLLGLALRLRRLHGRAELQEAGYADAARDRIAERKRSAGSVPSRRCRSLAMVDACSTTRNCKACRPGAEIQPRSSDRRVARARGARAGDHRGRRGPAAGQRQRHRGASSIPAVAIRSAGLDGARARPPAGRHRHQALFGGLRRDAGRSMCSAACAAASRRQAPTPKPRSGRCATARSR